jgi:glycosyltransferase involved in cell wall biosynthesis
VSVDLPKVLLSITSIPRRFDSSLREVISSLHAVEDQVVVCLPSHYRKWGPTPAPDYLKSTGNVVLFQPSQDYGPATKLLGAIEYIHSTKRKFDAIVTLDDDLYYADAPAAIDYLKRQSLERPGCVITIGGLKLERFPYRAKDGLSGNNIGYVDAVVGFRGVYYPADKIGDDRRLFDYASELPGGVFNDDDAYFGICLSRMGVPIYAVKPPRAGGRAVKLISTQGAGGSAVEEQAHVHRVENEMGLYQFAVTKGWLPSQSAKEHPDKTIRRLMKRSRFGSKLLRWNFNL